MQKTQIKLYTFITLFLLLIYIFFFYIFEFFTITHFIHEHQNSPNIENNTEDSSGNTILCDVEPQNNILNTSLCEKTTLEKPISLRDDKEFQESIARMEELVEYSRSDSIPSPSSEHIDTNVGSESTQSFDEGSRFVLSFDGELSSQIQSLDSKNNIEEEQIAQEREFFSNFDNYFDHLSDLHVNNQQNINNNSQLGINIDENEDINNRSEISVDNLSDISDTNFDYLLEASLLSDVEYTDSDTDTDSDIEPIELNNYLPPQKSAFEGIDISKMDQNVALQIFLNKMAEDLPMLKNNYNNEELGIGNTFTSESNSDINNLDNSKPNKMLNINSDNTLSVNVVGKETSNVSDIDKSTTTFMDRSDLKKKRMNQKMFGFSGRHQ